MLQLSRRSFIGLAGASVLCGCGSTSSITGNSDFPVLAFSDLHFDPFFDPDPRIFSALNSSDPRQWSTIFASSTIKTPSKPGSDTNYPLLVLTLASIRQNLGASPFILYAGDLLGHGILKNYETASGSTDTTAMQVFTDKVVSFVTQQIRDAAGDVPVLFAVGNCDSYTGYGPDSTFLSNTADLFYTRMLNGAANQQDFLASFTAAGYYAAEPTGTNVMVIGLNTIMFSPMVKNADGTENNQAAGNAELAWFDSKLASAKAAGKRVWVLMHAPPGADEGTTAQSIQPNGQIASATMMWEENYQATFMQVLSRYPGVIALTLAGHTHMDEYRIMSAGNVVQITPGISPCFNNDPAYKIYRLDRTALEPVDYRSLNYDLTTMPAQFNSYYTYSQAYVSKGSLEGSLERLFPKVVSDVASQALYRRHFYSGNNTMNPITDANWPIYWAGIGMMSEPDVVAGVNSYQRGA